MLIYYLYTQIQSNLRARFINPEKRLLGNVDSYWTPTWTLLFINHFIKPFKLEVSMSNHRHASLGDNYSIVEKEGVSYFLLIYMAFEGINFTQIKSKSAVCYWQQSPSTYLHEKPCSCTRTECLNQGDSTVLCKFGRHQLNALD